MAFPILQRLTSPSFSLSSRAIISRSSASISSTSPSSSPSPSAKVSDRIVKLFAIDPDGQKQEIIGLSGQTLLKALTNHGLIDPESHRLEEIEACSAECEVQIAQEWLDKLPPATYDEKYVLKRNARTRVLNQHSRLGCQVSKFPSFSLSSIAILSRSTASTSPSTRVSNHQHYSTSVYMNRSFPRSNSSVFLCGGNALQSEVVRLNEDMFLVDAGLGAPKICLKDELTGVPVNKSITRFENKVGSPDLVAGKALLQEQVLKRFFIDLVAGESLIKERATAKFNDMVGSTDGVAGEPLLVLPRRLRQNLVWMELNKALRTRKKVKGLLFKKIRGGFSVYIAGFVAFLPSRFRRIGKSNNRFTIESIKAKNKKMNIVLRPHREGMGRFGS